MTDPVPDWVHMADVPPPADAEPEEPPAVVLWLHHYIGFTAAQLVWRVLDWWKEHHRG